MKKKAPAKKKPRAGRRAAHPTTGHDPASLVPTTPDALVVAAPALLESDVAAALGLAGGETLAGAYEAVGAIVGALRNLEEETGRAVRALGAQAKVMAGALKKLAEQITPAQGGDIEARLNAASEATRVESSQWQAALLAAFETARATLVTRAQRHAVLARPQLVVRVRSLPRGQALVHVDRLSAPEAISLCILLAGRVPTRFEFLGDDSQQSLERGFDFAYAADLEARLGATDLTAAAMLRTPAQFIPVKAMIPLRAPADSGPVFRFVSRGPVLEAEIAEGEAFRNVLQQSEAEAVAARLLELKLAGRVGLVLAPG